METMLGLLDKGIVLGLFSISFIYIVWKGIPSLSVMAKDYLDRIHTEHTKQMEFLTTSFQKTLDTITLKYIDEQCQFNGMQQQKLEGISKLIEGIHSNVSSCKKAKTKLSK